MASLHGTVTSVELIARRMRRISITATELRGQHWLPGQQVRVHAAAPGSPSNKGPRRTFSIWSYTDDTIELCVFDHGGSGPGASWARAIGVGRPVTFGRPEGGFVLRPDAPYHLFVGEDTASVAFGAMLRALPAAARTHGLVEVDTPDDRLPLAESISWHYRAGRPAESSAGLVEALAGLELPAEPGIAYVAGEARTIQLVRRHLVRDRKWPRRSVLTKPFWTPGRTGMD